MAAEFLDSSRVMPMKVSIEFYRTRDCDEAHAVLGRVTREADDLDDAVAVARSLLANLEMPQWPDALTIWGANGKELCRREIGLRGGRAVMPDGDPFIDRKDDQHA
jgi:hypothetical protein